MNHAATVARLFFLNIHAVVTVVNVPFVIAPSRQHLDADEDGYRTEFINLVKTAQALQTR